jgi:hypothetical protein
MGRITTAIATATAIATSTVAAIATAGESAHTRTRLTRAHAHTTHRLLSSTAARATIACALSSPLSL